MANALDAYIPELWAQESVQILVENMVIANLIHTNFSSQVARFGDIVHTRKPAEFTAIRKIDTENVTVQDATATDIQVPLDQHLHTTFAIKDGEESKGFKVLRDEYLEPAIISIARGVDQTLLGEAHQFLVNGEGFGGNGLTTSNVIQAIVNTRKRMNINKAHMDSRNLILTPDTEAVALQTSTFHEADKVGDEGTAMREASLGRKFGFNTFMSQNTPSTIGMPSGVTGLLVDNAAGYNIGDTVIHVDGAGASLVEGMWLDFGTGAVHEITALGTLATQDIDVTINPPLRNAVADDQAVVVGDTGLAVGWHGEITVDGIVGAVQPGSLVKFATPGTPSVIKSAIYSVKSTTETAGDTTGITLNRPLDQALVNNDEINFGPPANYNFAFHRNALAMVSRPLSAAPSGLALSAVRDMAGVGMRITITYNGEKQEVLVTADLLFGVEPLDVNLGAVLIG